jgi:pimeloyl-ACP methyl ester carboxylesterase
VEAGGLKWAYRKSSGDDSSKQPVLLLHGIGSNSYQYRDLMRLLSLSGYDCYAPDWIGHGASDKVLLLLLAGVPGAQQGFRARPLPLLIRQ